jgi:hypothetical protein
VLPNGDLAVAGNRQLSNHGNVIDREDRPLYELVKGILWNVHVPDRMPAAIAHHCDDLVDARETLRDVDRGHVNFPGFASYGLGFCKAAAGAIESHRDRDPIRLIAVGCSGSKYDVDEPVPAAELYKGSYWSAKRQYYETIGDDGRIISAEHGVVHPEERIGYYERVPDDLRGIPIQTDGRLPNGDPVETMLDKWALDVYEGLSQWLRLEACSIDPDDVDLEILLGKKYREPLEERGVFDRLAIRGELSVRFPFQEVDEAAGGMLNQIGWMGDAVEATQSVATDGGSRD